MPQKKDSEVSPLPFLNIEFLKSPAARTIRILAEYLEPADRLRRANIRDTIVFFGSARVLSPEQLAAAGENNNAAAARLTAYYNDAVELSRRLTEWSMALTGNHDFI